MKKLKKLWKRLMNKIHGRKLAKDYQDDLWPMAKEAWKHDCAT